MKTDAEALDTDTRRLCVLLWRTWTRQTRTGFTRAQARVLDGLLERLRVVAQQKPAAIMNVLGGSILRQNEKGADHAWGVAAFSRPQRQRLS